MNTSAHRYIPFDPYTTIFTFCLLMALTASSLQLRGQQLQDIYIPEDIFQNSERTFLRYNDSQQLSEELTQAWLGTGAWMNSRRYQYEFNTETGDSAVAKVYQVWLQGGWRDAFREEYIYDESMNRTQVTSQQYAEILRRWVPSRRDLYRYDENGLRTEWLVRIWNDRDGWQNEKRFLYSYSPENLVTEHVFLEWERNEWRNVRRIQYLYDFRGNRIERLIQEWIGRGWTNIERYNTVYNDQGHATELTFRSWDGNTWIDRQREQFVYDEEGRLAEITTLTRLPGGEFSPISRKEQRYNDISLVREVVLAKWDGSEAFINEGRYSYDYNRRGNPTLIIFDIWNDGLWEQVNRQVFTYDDTGRLAVKFIER